MIPIPQFYRDIRLVRVQRQVGSEQCAYVLNFLKPLSERIGYWLAYEIDDVIGMDDIPKYNYAWERFQDPKLMENVRRILSVCDFITVTTPVLGDYFVRKFGVDKDRVLVIPNYLPRWWIGDVYDEEKISRRFERNQKRPRIAFASSTTHFDMRNQNGGVDDFTHVVDLVRKTVDRFEWSFIGGIPQQLVDLMKDGSVKTVGPMDLLNYPHQFNSLGFDLVVAPLQDNVFNRCKSNIKFIEMAAMGIPCVCQDLDPYRRYTDLLFGNSDELISKMDSLLSDEDAYMSYVKRMRAVVEKGDVNSPKGWWLENNMDQWMEIYGIKQKTLSFDMTKVRKREAPQPEILPKKDDGQAFEIIEVK